MFLEPLQRHLAVCARANLPNVSKLDPGLWNVISMRGPTQQKIERRGFRNIHDVICYDVRGVDPTEPDDTLGLPRKEHLQGVFHFVDALPGEPMLVHCHYGISRSTAVALMLIVYWMHYDGFPFDEIVREVPRMLLDIRPQAKPNSLILELGLREVFDARKAEEVGGEMLRRIQN